MTKLIGLENVLSALNAKLGPQKVNLVVNKVMHDVAQEGEEDLKEAVSSFVDTGRTVAQTTHSNVSRADYGIPTVKIGWGAGSRWRLEHLNEFGYTRNGRTYSPRGKHVLRDLIDRYEEKYPQKMQEGLRALLE